jgi:hypothetical protein
MEAKNRKMWLGQLVEILVGIKFLSPSFLCVFLGKIKGSLKGKEIISLYLELGK